MEGYIVDVLSLLLRWLHLIAGIAWIGASFYFVMLDSSLKPPNKAVDSKRGVYGELWAVHGGGFYNSQKFLAGPKGEPLSQDLHWSKWEAYATWLTGISLLALIYWHGAELYLIDPEVMALSQGAAIGTGVKMLSDVDWNSRSMVIFAVSLSIGLGLMQEPGALQHLPETAQALLTTGLLPAAFTAILLNLFVPHRADD